MTLHRHRHRHRHVQHDGRFAAQSPHPRRTPEQLEQARRKALRVFLQTAIGTAVLGGIFLLTPSRTLHEMAAFLLAWSAGWFCASAYLQLQRWVARARRSHKD